MALAIVKNKIVIRNPSDAIMRWAKDRLILRNPEYYKKLKLGKWVGNIPESIFLYEMVAGNLCVPFGCFKELYNTFKNECEFTSGFKPLRDVLYQSSINLYDYQEKAAQKALRARNGILVMPCGSGKTQTALEIVSRIGGRCLWLTHTQDLLNQSMGRAKSVLNTNASYGKITAGKVDIGEGITFATVQTMCNVDLKEYENAFDIVIVDECQHCCGSPTRVTQFYKVVSSLTARYKFGLTATPKRADGLERSMFALLGDVIYEVTKEDVADTTCPVKIRSIDTGYTPNYDAVLMGDGTIDYARLVDDLTHNSQRFEYVSNALETLDGATLVLANRVEYLQRLEKEYRRKSICLSALGNSKAAKAERKEALRKLNAGEIDCVLASYKLAAEGLDCPNLRYVVLATPEKDPSLVQQATGRVGRKANNKECGIVVDFIDDFGMYKGWAKKRESIYKKLGYAII